MSSNQEIQTQETNAQQASINQFFNSESFTTSVLKTNTFSPQNYSPEQSLSNGVCPQCGGVSPCSCNLDDQPSQEADSTTNTINNVPELDFHSQEYHFHHHNHDHHYDHHHGVFHFHDQEVYFDALPGVENTVIQEGNFNTEVSLAPATSLDLSQTFFLNSNPNAKHTIYLDFDGNTTTGTFWNSQYGLDEIFTPAYDFDGDTSYFSDSELTRIQNIWQRVAEDFMPFDVNVTTEDPGSDALRKQGRNDEEWGIRIAIGGSSQDWFSNGNSGGVAYIGSFNWSTDTPAFVFEENLSNGDEKFIAEAITHEVGHSLYLNHDGTGSSSYYSGSGSGETGWAPIMGTSYYKNLTQWSQGEYNNANNQEDDLAIITTRNGFDYRSDDHGDDNASATTLSFAGNSLSAEGIIERNTDYDVFSFFTEAGTLSLDVLPARVGANLDILAQIYDSQGTLIESSNPVDALSANFNLDLEAGKYYLHITGTGKNGAYSDYGSLGQYSLDGNFVAIEPDYLSIETTDVAQDEGDNTSQPFTFTVRRTGNLSAATTVEYVVIGDGTNPVNGEDFVGGVLPSGTINFGANETSQIITINVNGDQVSEQDEGFTVVLQNPGGNTRLHNPHASATIVNDDTEVTDNNQPQSGNNEIVGTWQNDTLTGSSENERIIGLAGSDTIETGEGDDVIVIKNISDGLDYVVDFDSDFDQVDVTGVLDSMGYTGSNPFADNVLRLLEVGFDGSTHVRLDAAADGDYSNGFKQLVFFNNVSLAEFDSSSNFIGVESNENPQDNSHEDSNAIVGSAVNDTLTGSSENERIIGLAGNDTIETGEGNDVIVLNTVSEGLDHVVDFDSDFDQVDVTGVLNSMGYTGDNPFADNVLRLLEISFGGSTHVRLDAAEDANYGNGFQQLVFFHDVSLNELDSASNFITITVNEIVGSVENDTLTGSPQRDHFIGLAGNDTIETGEGNDVIVLNTVSEGLDHVVDFDSDFDQVDVTGVLNSMGYIGSDPFADKVLRLLEISFGGSTHVRLDTAEDGNYGNGFDQLVFFHDVNLAELDSASNFITNGDSNLNQGNSLEIVSSEGDDRLTGLSSDDIFIGLGGNDTISTGGGKDVVVLNEVSEGVDYVLDFDATLDKVDVTGVLDSINYTGDNPFADKVLRLLEISFGGSTHVRLDAAEDGNFGNGFDKLVFMQNVSLAELNVTNNFIV